MANTTRIKDLTETTTLSPDMNLAVDNASGGTKRIQLSTLIDENLTTAGKAADAKAAGDEITDLKNALLELVNTDNILLSGEWVKNAYYYEAKHESASYDYFIVDVTSGNSYYFPQGLRFLSKISAGVYSHSNWTLPYTYTADFTGKLYVTMAHDCTNYYMYQTSADPDTIGSVQHPALSKDILSQEFGYSKKKTVSQDALTKNLKGVFSISDDRNMLLKAVIHEGYYFYSGAEYSSSSYDYFVIPVTSGTTYMISAGIRFVCKASSNLINNSDLIPLVYTADFTGDLYLSFASDGYGYYVVDSTKYGTMVGAFQRNALTNAVKHYSKGFASAKTASMSADDVLYLTSTNVKKNNRYYFTARITSFSALQMGHGKNDYEATYIEITTTKVNVVRRFSSADVSSYNHNLTITGDIAVSIIVKNNNTADITVSSNGTSSTIENVSWFGDSGSDYFVLSSGSSFTDCCFTWTSPDFVKRCWLFGDSYVSISDPARWCYYLNQNNDIDKTLISGFGGETSAQGATALIKSTTYYGSPDILIWAYGMNDGSDSSSAPSSVWISGIREMMKICANKGITPILCTIPTVPNISHEKKNEWVRASGYRYIDFAKAVGANSSGVWYSGMLYSDNVHPTELGAKALYLQAMIDCPELSLDD